MKAKLFLLGLVVVGVGCGSSSPKSFMKRSAKLACQSVKKCEEATWNEAGYSSVADCVDVTLPEDKLEAFVDMCEDFDRGKARECLAAGREYKRSCDDNDITAEDIKVCAEVCGGSLGAVMGQEIDPMDPDTIRYRAEIALELMSEELDEPEEEPASELLMSR